MLMSRKEQISKAYEGVPDWAKKNINIEGWIPHRYLLELFPFYNREDLDFIGRELVRPKILRL